MQEGLVKWRGLLFFFSINYVLLGIGVTLIGATLPAVIRGFGWSYWVAGSVLAGSAVGYFVSTFGCGFLVRRWGPKKVIVFGLLVQGVGLGLFGLRGEATFNLAALFLLGLGGGGSEVVINCSIVQMEKPGQSRLTSLLHAAFTVGAIIGPLLAGGLLAAQLEWQRSFQVLGLVCALQAGGLAAMSFAGLHREEEKAAPVRALGQLLRQPLLVLLSLVLLLYVGAEVGISNWLAEYFVEAFGASKAMAANMVSVYWAGQLLGRLLVWVGYRGRRQGLLLVCLSGAACLPLIWVLSADGVWLAAAGFFLSGLGFSAIYPVVIVLAGQYFKEEQSLAIGLVATAGGIGAFVLPFIMSWVAERYGVIIGFWFYALIVVVMAAAAVGVWWRVRHLEAPS